MCVYVRLPPSSRTDIVSPFLFFVSCCGGSYQSAVVSGLVGDLVGGAAGNKRTPEGKKRGEESLGFLDFH
jgi:hypothetical protein